MRTRVDHFNEICNAVNCCGAGDDSTTRVVPRRRRRFSTTDESLGKSVAGMFKDTIAVGPHNRQIGYVIRRHDKWIVVVNGTEQQPYDGIGEAHPIVSPDGSHFAYVAGIEGKSFVVVDGVESQRYDAVLSPSLIFSPDSQRVASWPSVVEDG